MIESAQKRNKKNLENMKGNSRKPLQGGDTLPPDRQAAAVEGASWRVTVPSKME
ncbi:MAG: hypothetical protein FWF31_03270 [Desulfobulbus sp.]|nr:hypothetical protein [Desulfobulbus sp.]